MILKADPDLDRDRHPDLDPDPDPDRDRDPDSDPVPDRGPDPDPDQDPDPDPDPSRTGSGLDPDWPGPVRFLVLIIKRARHTSAHVIHPPRDKRGKYYKRGNITSGGKNTREGK